MELRNPFVFLWNENSNTLILYKKKKKQISVRQLCVHIYLQESASFLLDFYSINTLTTCQAPFKKNSTDKEAKLAIKYLNY